MSAGRQVALGGPTLDPSERACKPSPGGHRPGGDRAHTVAAVRAGPTSHKRSPVGNKLATLPVGIIDNLSELGSTMDLTGTPLPEQT